MNSEFAAAIAIGVTGAASAAAIAMTGTAAVGALSEKPEIFGKTILYIAFAEAIAIYGLLVALMILMK